MATHDGNFDLIPKISGDGVIFNVDAFFKQLRDGLVGPTYATPDEVGPASAPPASSRNSDWPARARSSRRALMSAGRPRRSGRVTIDDWASRTNSNFLEGRWYDALLELDKKGEKGPLVSLLQSGRPPSAVVSFHIGDVFNRYELKNKPGRPRVPSYTVSDKEHTALYVSARVDDLVKGGMKRSDAVAKVAKENKMSENTVANAHEGRRGSGRRFNQRRPKPTKPSKG
jgi:hypothetical protein